MAKKKVCNIGVLHAAWSVQKQGACSDAHWCTKVHVNNLIHSIVHYIMCSIFLIMSDLDRSL